MREYFRFTSPLPPLSRHRAGSRIRESICASWKIRGVEREFSIDDGDVPYCRAHFHISASYTIPGDARGFLHPPMEHGARNYGIVAPLILSRSYLLNKINIYEHTAVLLADLHSAFSLPLEFSSSRYGERCQISL